MLTHSTCLNFTDDLMVEAFLKEKQASIAFTFVPLKISID